jgi:hypothetical protein
LCLNQLRYRVPPTNMYIQNNFVHIPLNCLRKM